MTNLQILISECSARGITEEVHTFARWKQLGYSVKKGEHALFSTSLWKQCKGRRKDNEEISDNSEPTGRCYLCKSYLFGRSQVEEILDDENPI